MTDRVAVAAVLVCVLLAGCGGLPTESETTTDGTTGTTAEQERVIAAPPGNGTTDGTAGTTITSASGTTASTTRTTETTATDDPDSGLSVFIGPDGEVHVDLEAI